MVMILCIVSPLAGEVPAQQLVDLPLRIGVKETSHNECMDDEVSRNIESAKRYLDEAWKIIARHLKHYDQERSDETPGEDSGIYRDSR